MRVSTTHPVTTCKGMLKPLGPRLVFRPTHATFTHTILAKYGVGKRQWPGIPLPLIFTRSHHPIDVHYSVRRNTVAPKVTDVRIMPILNLTIVRQFLHAGIGCSNSAGFPVHDRTPLRGNTVWIDSQGVHVPPRSATAPLKIQQAHLAHRREGSRFVPRRFQNDVVRLSNAFTHTAKTLKTASPEHHVARFMQALPAIRSLPRTLITSTDRMANQWPGGGSGLENIEPLRPSKLQQPRIAPTRLVESFPQALPDHRVLLALSPFFLWRRALSQKISQNTRSHAVIQHMMQGAFHSLLRSWHTALTTNRWEYRLRPSSHRQGEARAPMQHSPLHRQGETRAPMQHSPLHRQGEARAQMQPARPNRSGARLEMPYVVARAHMSRGAIYGGARGQAYWTTLPQPARLLLPAVQPSRTRLRLSPPAFVTIPHAAADNRRNASGHSALMLINTRTMRRAPDFSSPYRTPLEMQLAKTPTPTAQDFAPVIQDIATRVAVSQTQVTAVSTPTLDINHLTNQVYQEIERKVRIERERRGL